MAESFSIAFEQVQLVNGLAPDQPVWLFMRATLKDASRLDVPLDTREIGSFPPDANRPLPPEYRIDDSGFYAPSLVIPALTRNDVTDSSTSQVFPRFELDSIEVADGQVLEVEVFMLPRVWFKQIKVSQDDLDRWSRAGFLALLGASGFGLIGAVGGAILGGIWGTEDIDATLPCYQTVISALHSFTLDDLRALSAEGMRQYGPNDNDEGPCGYVDSFYWLSANQHRAWGFPVSPPIQQQDCELLPWRHEPAGDWLGGTWLDRDSWEASCIGVSVNLTSADHADVSVYDHPHGGTPPRDFIRRPILRDRAPNQFSYNVFGGDCPPRSAKPTCPECKRFSNVSRFVLVPAQMLAALAIAPRHVGSEGWGEGMARRSLAGPGLGCVESERRRRASGQHGAGEAGSLAPGLLFRREGKDMIAMWPAGTPAPPRSRPHRHTRPAGLADDVTVVVDKGFDLADILFGCFKVPLSEREALFTYAEVPAKGEPRCPRLRYVRWDDEGRIIKDAMLQRWFRPPA